jgi:beta-lactamase superfamily II metal-dependent hydrolase
MPTKFIGEDFVRLRRRPASRSEVFLTLAFGDAVEVLDHRDGFVKLRSLDRFDGTAVGWADNTPALAFREKGLLKFSMVDVQQGDGLILESPSGQIVLIDGGDNKLFARHCAARFRHRKATKDDPLDVAAIIVTHGDADHFDGLNVIRRTETERGLAPRKRLPIHPKRIFHNGLLKAPSSVPERDRFGRTAQNPANGETYILDIRDDTRSAAPGLANRPFAKWHETIDHWETRGPIQIERVGFDTRDKDQFRFLKDEGIDVEIQGPFPEDVADPESGSIVKGLRYLRRPKKSPNMHLRGGDEGSISASHTINGHSIALRISFGNVRLNLTGDLNRPAMRIMRQNLTDNELEAEIVKAPHHGSADFDFEALKAMSPVVAIISSGDEKVSKEHIHPRATLMSAMGKVMRLSTGILFCTELAAFFAMRDYSNARKDLKKYFKARSAQTFTGAEIAKLFTGKVDQGDPEPVFFGFERTNFGIIHIRTDGERVLAFTHSGKKGLNEAYAFTVKSVNGAHVIEFADKVAKR